jgi:hypothetical protein
VSKTTSLFLRSFGPLKSPTVLLKEKEEKEEEKKEKEERGKEREKERERKDSSG